MNLIETLKAKIAEQQQKEQSGGGYFDGKITVNNPTGFNLTSAIAQPNDAMKKAAREVQITIPPGYTMPLHYLTPMTREQINQWLGLFFVKKKLECEQTSKQFCGAKALGYMYIELMNLAYVNGFATYDQLQAGYKEASAFLADVPEIPSFKEQLKNAGKSFVGAVVGFVTGGPVGLFAGLATTAAKIVTEERLKRAMQGQSIVAQNIQKIDEAAQAREAIAQEEKKTEVQTTILTYVAIAAAIGIIIYATK